jgi:hypothetical protein
MKKIFIGMLFVAALANAQLSQRLVLGNWTLEPGKVALGENLTLESSVFHVTPDWKYTEDAVYTVNFAEYGKEKIKLKYKVQFSSKGEYRMEKGGLRKYLKTYEPEISDASNEDAAKTSLKDFDRLLKALSREAIPIASAADTVLELLVAGNNSVKYTKPKNLPISKITKKTVPFHPLEGWRYPETAKELESFDIRVKNDVNLFTLVEADFNGDGLQDAVAYLLNDESGRVALFLHLSKPDGSYSLAPYGSADRNTIIENGVFLAPAGEYTNISNKQTVKIPHDGFLIVIFDTAATLVYIDAKGEWRDVPIGKRF